MLSETMRSGKEEWLPAISWVYLVLSFFLFLCLVKVNFVFLSLFSGAFD